MTLVGRSVLSGSVDDPHVPGVTAEAEAFEEPAHISKRLMWWHWMKAYGMFAPAVVLPLLRDWFGLSIGTLWIFFLGAAGYLLAVRWLLNTQLRERPWGLQATVWGFVLSHAVLMTGLGWLIWRLTVAGRRLVF